MGSGASLRLGVLASLVVALACGIVLHQARTAAAIRSAMEIETERLAERVSTGHDAGRRLPVLREELARTNVELTRLRDALPDCGSEGAGLAWIRLRTVSAGLDVSASGDGVVARDFYSEERLSLLLRGEDGAIEAFLDAPGGRERPVNVEVLGRRPGTASVVITHYCESAAPVPGRRASPRAAREGAAVWLPPFRQRLEERRRTLAGLRSEVARLEPVLREVDELRDSRTRLHMKREIVNHLWEVCAKRQEE